MLAAAARPPSLRRLHTAAAFTLAADARLLRLPAAGGATTTPPPPLRPRGDDAVAAAGTKRQPGSQRARPGARVGGGGDGADDKNVSLPAPEKGVHCSRAPLPCCGCDLPLLCHLSSVALSSYRVRCWICHYSMWGSGRTPFTNFLATFTKLLPRVILTIIG